MIQAEDEHKNPDKKIDIHNQRITRRMKKLQKNSKLFQHAKNEKCPICLGKCGTNSVALPCTHVFCIDCIANWWQTNSTCPYCRQKFQVIYDHKGRRMAKHELPLKLLIPREDTLKCQCCWADIGQQPMRICYQCRGIYAHKRCLAVQELKVTRWKCEECFQNQEQLEKRNQEKKDKKEKSFSYFGKLNADHLSQRHSQRISCEKWK